MSELTKKLNDLAIYLDNMCQDEDALIIGSAIEEITSLTAEVEKSKVINSRLERACQVWERNSAGAVELEREVNRLTAEVEKLEEAITDAGFAVMKTSGKWSIHDVSERGKAEEAKCLEVATENAVLAAEVERLSKALFDLSPGNNPAMQGSAVDSAIAWIVDLKAEVERLRAAVAEEREACAQVADKESLFSKNQSLRHFDQGFEKMAKHYSFGADSSKKIAAAIRERGKQ